MKQADLRADAFICYLSGIAWIVCFTAWLFFGKFWFEIGTAFVIFGALGYFAKSKPTILSRFLYFVATNNLFDEVIGDPYAVTWTEYVLAAIFLIYYIFIQKYVPATKYRTEKWIKQLTKKH